MDFSKEALVKKNAIKFDRRPYRARKAAIRFFCPLCSMERSVSCKPRLDKWNYVQILVSWIFFSVILFPLMEWNSFYFLFIIWFGFEAAARLRFKKEIPCPHCGFDATWYKRDVKVARKLVDQFWSKDSQVPEIPDGVIAANADTEAAPETRL